MNTEENKLIAEFMGYKVFNNGFGDCYSNIKTDYNDGIYKFIKGCKEYQLQFHDSWDWLMPVVDKIYSSNEYVKYKDTMSGIFNEEPVRINSKYISVTHKAVVEFIKWYNEQKH